MRLDRWIKRRYPVCTQGVIEKALRKRFIRVNGVKQAAGTPLEAGDQVNIEIHLHHEWDTASKTETTRQCPSSGKMDWRPLIIDETLDFLILNKPSGMDVQGGTNVGTNLADALSTKGYRLVHRIDRATSGLLIVAKTLSAAVFLTGLFREHKVRKTYRAIVLGKLSQPSGVIELPILVKGEHRAAQTRFKVVFEEVHGHWTDVTLSPLTGRKHQLRIHMASLGHPIVGDQKYDTDGQTEGLLSGKAMFLHAQSLMFHDKTGKERKWKVPLPPYWPQN